MNLTEKFLQLALGGAEWVLWLLVILSVLSVYVMIERALFFNTVSGSDRKARKGLLGSLADGDVEGAQGVLKDTTGAGCHMVTDMLDAMPRGKLAIEAARDAARPAEKLRLEKNLAYLGTVGANAPFIGLFGTVLGIIKAFKDLADAGLQAGGESSAVVMAGISEALVATAVGLLVAIPAVVAYNIFQRRVKNMLGDADSLASAALGLMVGESVSDGSDGESGDGKDD